MPSIEQSERIGGATFLGVTAFDALVSILDNYGRLVLLVNLRDRLPQFLVNPITTFICMCLGLSLLYHSHQKQLERMAVRKSERKLIDTSGTEIVRIEKPGWLIPVSVAFLVALVAAPLLAVGYSLAYTGVAPRSPRVPSPPVFAYVMTPNPAIPHPSQVPSRGPVAIAPNGIAIGGGTVSNPTVNNFGPLNRRLNQQQNIALVASARSVCSTLPPISVTASQGNQEAQRYALDFVNALRGGGCKADLSLPIPGLTADVTGVLIGVRDTNSLDAIARALKQMLSDSGIEFPVVPMKPDFFPNEKTILVVGARE